VADPFSSQSCLCDFVIVGDLRALFTDLNSIMRKPKVWRHHRGTLAFTSLQASFCTRSANGVARVRRTKPAHNNCTSASPTCDSQKLFPAKNQEREAVSFKNANTSWKAQRFIPRFLQKVVETNRRAFCFATSELLLYFVFREVVYPQQVLCQGETAGSREGGSAKRIRCGSRLGTFRC